LIAAVALLYSTTHGMAVQIKRLREQVDPHWRRGISYLKIGLRWLRGVVNKGRQLLIPVPLLMSDPQPCFSSKKTKEVLQQNLVLSNSLVTLQSCIEYRIAKMCQAISCASSTIFVLYLDPSE
jgi:hypothetical protein